MFNAPANCSMVVGFPEVHSVTSSSPKISGSACLTSVMRSASRFIFDPRSVCAGFTPAPNQILYDMTLSVNRGGGGVLVRGTKDGEGVERPGNCARLHESTRDAKSNIIQYFRGMERLYSRELEANGSLSPYPFPHHAEPRASQLKIRVGLWQQEQVHSRH